MPPQLKLQGVNIVLRGSFNPAIFHPSWFAAQGLIRSQEADAAEVKVVHPQAAVFDADWLRVQATPDRFQLSTIQEAFYELLRDLVVGVFRLLNHTPLTVLGINRDFHYSLASEQAWHAVGDTLTPKEPWSGILERPGMQNVTIQGMRPDDLEGYIRVKVEPSVKVTPYGVYVDVNDHYVLNLDDRDPSPANQVVSLLSTNWQQSLRRGSKIADSIVQLGEFTI